MSNATALQPLAKSVIVSCAPERAFTVFTREIGSWWPTESLALHPGEVEQIVWEEHEGGIVYEIATGGEQGRWATVLTWEPPHRLVIAWQVNEDRHGTEVEVRFTAVAEGTRVDLEHRGFDNVRDGAEMRTSYDPGWDRVLGRLVAIVG